ncbi:MAG TPA: DUF2232 domain-containing protein [Clostridia bacterium]|nr:DUF2232 domain-containing protein [Clostridia bacterium]
MENREKQPGILAALLSGLLGALSFLFPPLLFVSGGSFSYILIGGGFFKATVSLAASAGLAYFMFGASGLLVLALMLPAAVCLYIMLKQKAPYFETALLLSGLYAGILYLLINAGDLLAGNSAFYTLTELFKSMWNEYAELASNLPGVLDAQKLKAFRLFGSSLFAKLPIIMPAAICSISAFMGLFNMLICTRLLKRTKADLKSMREFALWRLPKSFIQGLGLMAAGTLLASFLNVPAMDAVVPAVIAVALIPFSVQGLSTLWFFVRLRPYRATLIKVLLIVIVAVSFPLSIFSLALVGVIEQLLKLRKRIIDKINNSGN